MKKIGILFFFAMGIAQMLQAQLFDKPEPLTLKDTLRGMLRPERTCYDVTFYDLSVKVDIDNKYISGSNTVWFTAMEDFVTLQIDLFANLKVDKILYKGQPMPFERKFDAIFVHFPKTKKGTQSSFTIEYEGNPQIAKNAPWDGGFSFDKDKNGNNWVGVSCEGLGASVWWPNKDHLSDEPDSMRITGIVPEGLTCVANGNLVREYSTEPGWHAFEWHVSYPINNYDVSLNIAKYAHLSDIYINKKGDSLALDYYVLDYNVDKAKKQFTQVKPMLKCYEDYLGNYPFYKDGYALVETPYLGMEHQSAIAYGNEYKTGYAGYDYSGIGLNFDYIIIHESGHEWWGNNVSMKDEADMWIHEGFCTYTESIYVECMFGYVTAMKYIDAMKRNIANDAPIIGPYDVNREGSSDMYSKGAVFLNTLRTLTDNDQLWWSILKGIQKDFALQTVTTAQIENYISRKAGKDYSKEFDQFLRNKDLPVLEYSLTPENGNITFKFRWKADVANFDMPLRYKNAKGEWVWFTPSADWQSMTISDMTQSEFQLDTTHFYFNEKLLRN